MSDEEMAAMRDAIEHIKSGSRIIEAQLAAARGRAENASEGGGGTRGLWLQKSI